MENDDEVTVFLEQVGGADTLVVNVKDSSSGETVQVQSLSLSPLFSCPLLSPGAITLIVPFLLLSPLVTWCNHSHYPLSSLVTSAITLIAPSLIL